MIERRLPGRRFVDYYPDAAPLAYPGELERRVSQRRAGDRNDVTAGLQAFLPGQRRRPPILFSGILRCANCGRELRRTRNISGAGRKYFLAEFSFLSRRAYRCECGAAQSAIEWLLQAGTE